MHENDNFDYDLTLTRVVFELNPSASKPICLNYLTLTSVVFEFFMPFTSTTSSIHLTLTIVVFEFGDIK